MTLRAVFQIGLHYAHKMAGFDPELRVEVSGNEILVTLPRNKLFSDLLQAKGPAMVGRQGHRA